MLHPCICVPVCSKIPFLRFGTSPGTAKTRCNAKNRQAYQNLQILAAICYASKLTRMGKFYFSKKDGFILQ
jgi:hypothetical protein